MSAPMWGIAYPIFEGRFDASGDVELTGARGTGFVPVEGVLVTCAHCVVGGEDELFVPLPLADAPEGVFVRLTDVSVDASGLDLATASVALRPEKPFRLLAQDVAPNADVLSVGFPYVDVEAGERGRVWTINARLLRGYVTRTLVNDAYRGWPPHPTLELDMPAPRGLSGSPLFAHGRGEQVLAGVVYGAHTVDTVEALSTVDPDTGERSPELVHSVSFGWAIPSSALGDLAGPATGGRRLADLIERA